MLAHGSGVSVGGSVHVIERGHERLRPGGGAMVPVRLPGAIEIALGTSRGAPLGEPEDGLSGVAGFGSVCARNVQLQRGAAHKVRRQSQGERMVRYPKLPRSWSGEGGARGNLCRHAERAPSQACPCSSSRCPSLPPGWSSQWRSAAAASASHHGPKPWMLRTGKKQPCRAVNEIENN